MLAAKSTGRGRETPTNSSSTSLSSVPFQFQFPLQVINGLARRMTSSAEEFDTIDGGCQCSLIRYRVTLPQNGTKLLVNGNQYPYANHCNYLACGKSYSTLTHTALNIPVSCIQFATRIPYSRQAPTQSTPSRTPSVRITEFPPSYAVSSMGSSLGRRYSTASTSSSATIASVTSASSTSTGATWISPSSATSIPTHPQRGASFIEVDTPEGCCTSATTPSLTAIAGPPNLPQMLLPQPKPAYYSSLAADARQNPLTGRGSTASQSVSPRRGGASQESPYFQSSVPSASAGKRPAGPPRLGETINPLAAVTPHVQNAKQRPQPSPSSSTAPPFYSRLPQQPGVYVTRTLTIPWPYKEFPLSDDVNRRFCRYCGGGLLVRPACIVEENEAIELAAGSLDYPEQVLGQAGIFDSSIKACSNWNGEEERLRLLNEWDIGLGEGR
ncbi:hypothetical protein EV426DRAFT_572357 [Tirmania nivea]|nr:hypothetical protein EV426DRAFT_572357 [Tirmania nivea]